VNTRAERLILSWFLPGEALLSVDCAATGRAARNNNPAARDLRISMVNGFGGKVKEVFGLCNDGGKKV